MKIGSPCHKCPHGLTDEDGLLLDKFKGRSIESLPCETCKLEHGSSILEDSDASNGWRSKVGLEELDFFPDEEVTGWNSEREDWTDRHHISEFLRLMLRLDHTSYRIVSHWLLGGKVADIAVQLGMSAQGAHKRLQDAHKQIPDLQKAGSVIRKER